MVHFNEHKHRKGGARNYQIHRCEIAKFQVLHPEILISQSQYSNRLCFPKTNCFIKNSYYRIQLGVKRLNLQNIVRDEALYHLRMFVFNTKDIATGMVWCIAVFDLNFLLVPFLFTPFSLSK